MEEKKDLLGKLESAKAKLSQVTKMKCAVILENSKVINVIKGCMYDSKENAFICKYIKEKKRAAKKIENIFLFTVDC